MTGLKRVTEPLQGCRKLQTQHDKLQACSEYRAVNSLAEAFRALARLASHYHKVTWPVTVCPMFPMIILRRVGHHVTGWDITV